MDHRRDPAEVLVRLYHERWEIESAFYSLRHTLLTGRVLRSQEPRGLEQEVWALLTLYHALRMAMAEAVKSVPGGRPGPGQLHRRPSIRPRPGDPRRPRPADPAEPHRKRLFRRCLVRSAATQALTHQRPQRQMPGLPLSGGSDQRASPDQPEHHRPRRRDPHTAPVIRSTRPQRSTQSSPPAHANRTPPDLACARSLRLRSTVSVSPTQPLKRIDGQRRRLARPPFIVQPPRSATMPTGHQYG
ncbi:hypothetical protein [Streptomyces syringium]|uniref:hypothetical protein n=1 Tax=Streptomyces syringium TaxID=76729 RepID=UPI00345365B8